MVAWGRLNGTVVAEFRLGVPPSGKSFAVPFTNVATFADELMMGESIYLTSRRSASRRACHLMQCAAPPRNALRRQARSSTPTVVFCGAHTRRILGPERAPWVSAGVFRALRITGMMRARAPCAYGTPPAARRACHVSPSPRRGASP